MNLSSPGLARPRSISDEPLERPRHVPSSRQTDSKKVPLRRPLDVRVGGGIEPGNDVRLFHEPASRNGERLLRGSDARLGKIR